MRITFTKSLPVVSTVAILTASACFMPVVLASPDGGWLAALGRVFNPKPPQRKAGGGKGPEAIISPGVWGNDRSSLREVWQLQPVILYQSPKNALEAPDRLRLVNDKTGKVIQYFDVKGKAYAVLSVKTGLSSGMTYRIDQLRYQSNRPIANASVNFKVMSDRQRQAIAAELKSLPSENLDESLIQSLEVFQKHGLWSDVLHEVAQKIQTDEDWQKLQAMLDQLDSPMANP